MPQREKFGKFGALMTMAGSAVGLGNLWRFPYLLGENGGAVFLFVYLLCSFLIALPIFFAEFIIGRRGGENCFGCFSKLSGGSKWKYAGLIGVLTPAIILSFYSVVGGWGVQYFMRSCTFELAEFNSLISSVWPPIIGHTIFLLLTAVIVMMGVKKGIESFGKIAMPALFVLVVGIAIYVAFQPGAAEGYRYLFNPDFSKLDDNCIISALGQAFFSLSLGCGCIMTFASYVSKKDSAVSHSVNTALLDVLFALIAGCAIMPAVFAYGLSPTAGPSLLFDTLPRIFNQMPAGEIVAVLFFLALLVAALTSSISLLEVVVAYFVEEKKMERKKAVLMISVFAWVLGCLCSLSFGPLSNVKLFSLSIFEFFDKLTSDYLMIIGAFLTVVFAGWIMKRSDFEDEFLHSNDKASKRLLKPILLIIRYVAPIAILMIFVTGLCI